MAGSPVPILGSIPNIDLLLNCSDPVSGHRCEALSPYALLNPTAQYEFACMATRVLDPNAPLPRAELEPALLFVI